ncbi:hypothetical protein DSOUD_0603 [Desulfuromonas soudanensis]|uniref:Uncharacterized protein n=1 Tax=Desulfuromonas soudanensis TaxID=1603606 RepID=A0A0M4D7E5_9BACT|nr:hypothetical protein [Desulfuromonas soudanensis]ALC15392.1 hypothetical protein DSOUD_0603 [Desulfuromonas soudanensis]
MTEKTNGSGLWQKVPALTAAFSGKGIGPTNFADPAVRTLLVAKARWLALLVVGLYGTCAMVMFIRSPYGFFLSHPQVLFLAGAVAFMVVYNGLCHFFYEKINQLRCNAQFK